MPELLRDEDDELPRPSEEDAFRTSQAAFNQQMSSALNSIHQLLAARQEPRREPARTNQPRAPAPALTAPAALPTPTAPPPLLHSTTAELDPFGDVLIQGALTTSMTEAPRWYAMCANPQGCTCGGHPENSTEQLWYDCLFRDHVLLVGTLILHYETRFDTAASPRFTIRDIAQAAACKAV